MKRVALIFGGNSPESDVSVITSMQAYAALDKSKYEVFPVYFFDGAFWLGRTFEVSEYANFDKKTAKSVIFADGKMHVASHGRYKRKADVDCVLNCCHGGDGENGNLSGYLEISGVPCTSASVISASVSMDKDVSKRLFRDMGIKTAPWVAAKRGEFDAALKEAELNFWYPMIVKPSDLGSSIGIGVANGEAEAHAAAEVAYEFSDKIVVESFLADAFELAVAVTEKSDGSLLASPVEKPVFKGKIFDFADKYLSGTKGGLEEAGREFPAKIDADVADEAARTAKRIYAELGFSGVVRIDFLLKQKNLYASEINAVPGSLSSYLIEGAGLPFSDMLDNIIEAAICRFNAKKRLKRRFESKILHGFDFNK